MVAAAENVTASGGPLLPDAVALNLAKAAIAVPALPAPGLLSPYVASMRQYQSAAAGPVTPTAFTE